MFVVDLSHKQTNSNKHLINIDIFLSHRWFPWRPLFVDEALAAWCGQISVQPEQQTAGQTFQSG